MFEIKKLLVPVDFSPRSEAASKHAAAIAAHFGAEILFLYAVPHGPYEHGLFEAGFNAGSVWPAAEEIESAVAGQLTAFMDRTAPNAKRFAQVATGGAAEKIKEAAEQEQVDLIVMPTHGYGPFRRFILGSVTAKVLHDVAFPVFTGAHVETIPVGEVRPYRVVACAVDLAPHSEAVLGWARDFSEAVGAKLHVIHAAPSIEGLTGEQEHLPANLPETVAAARKAQVEELMARLNAKGESHVACDEVSDYVPAATAEIGADLLVIGRSGEVGSLGRLRSDSMSLIRESPCPVVSI
jgi:nucleotide-binding universal stress UspA family protein